MAGILQMTASHIKYRYLEYTSNQSYGLVSKDTCVQFLGAVSCGQWLPLRCDQTNLGSEG